MYRIPKQWKYKLSIRLAVLTVFILANVLIAAIALGLQYYFSKQMATDSAFSYYDSTASQTADYLLNIDQQATLSTSSLARIPALVVDDDIGQSTQQLFAQVIQSSPSFYSAFVGFDNGDLYQLINLAVNNEVRRNLNAAPSDRWLVVNVTSVDGQRTRRTSYFDQDFNLRVSHAAPSDYDVRTRPWFVNAQSADVYKTAPYLFKSLQAPGQTYSAVIPNTNHVVAIDIALSSLSTYLDRQKLSGEGEIYLYQKTGEIIANNQVNPLQVSLSNVERMELTRSQHQYIEQHGHVKLSNSADWSPIDFSIAGKPQGYVVDIMKIVSAKTGIVFEYINGHTWPELLAMYGDGTLDAMPAVYLNNENKALGSLSDTIVDLPFSVVTRPGNTQVTKVEQLFGKTLAITQGWSISKILKESYPQITLVEVPLLKDVFEEVRSGRVDAGIDSKLILQHTAKQFFIDGIAFHPALDFGEANVPSSLHLLSKDQQLVDIVSAALAQITPQVKQQLDTKWGISAAKQTGAQANGVVPYQQLIELAGQRSFHNKLTVREIAGESYFIYVKPLGNNNGDMFSVIVPVDRVLGVSLAEIQWSMLITSVCLLLMLALTSLFVSPIKQLSRQNIKIKQRKFKEIVHTSSNIVEIEQLSQSMIEIYRTA